MAKKNVETVITSVNPSTNNEILPMLDNLTPTQRAELFAMLRRDSGVVAQAVEIDKARIDALNAEKTRIEEEMKPLNARLAEIHIELKSLTGKSIHSVSTGERAPRVACPSCGQSRHADNEKTANCAVYPGFMAKVNEAKTAKKPLPTFTQYLAATSQSAS